MQDINKSYIYKQLNQIRDTYNIDVSKYITSMIGNNEIPYETLVFVNKYIPIELLTTYNKIFEKRRKSPLFRNIVKKDNTVEEKAIILSSLLTQSLICKKKLSNVESDAVDGINADVIISALHDYIYNNNDKVVIDLFETYQIIFKTLFPKNS